MQRVAEETLDRADAYSQLEDLKSCCGSVELNQMCVKAKEFFGLGAGFGWNDGNLL
jgi:hypothetical protein